MTLVDKLREQRTGAEYGPGVRHDDLMKPILSRIAKSHVFVIDQDVVTMAAGVSLSKPSSILQSLPWVRLPFESTWIEFNPEDLSRAYSELGSPLLEPPGTKGRLKGAGFLLTMSGTTLYVEFVHLMDTPGVGAFADLCSVVGEFDLSDIGTPEPTIAYLGKSAHDKAKGRMRQYQKLLASDTSEAAAHEEIINRLDWTYNPDMAPAARVLAPKIGQAGVDALHVGWITELERLFTMALLPILLLINAKNAIGIDDGPDLSKLNKARLKKHRHPLVEHKIVKMRLAANQQRRASASGDGSSSRRGGWWIGHFKTRKTGIFWWHPHARAGYGAITKTIHVTR